ncbi:trimeric intracellular cation channel family protein [Calidifontibacter terrae]
MNSGTLSVLHEVDLVGIARGGSLADIVRAVDLIGVAANGLLGGEIARRERLDPVGFTVLAIISALGGGLLRDTLLQRGTPVALTDSAYLMTAVGAAVVAYLITFEGRLWNRIYPALDGLALGTWAAVGTQKSLSYGLGWLPSLLLGVITAVGGGMVRDIILSRRPAFLGGNTLYATCAIISSGVAILLNGFVTPEIGILAATAIGAPMVIIAKHRGWTLPGESARQGVRAIRRRYPRQP